MSIISKVSNTLFSISLILLGGYFLEIEWQLSAYSSFFIALLFLFIAYKPAKLSQVKYAQPVIISLLIVWIFILIFANQYHYLQQKDEEQSVLLAEFNLKKDKLINDMKKFMQSGDYDYIIAITEQYDELGDIELNEIKQQAMINQLILELQNIDENDLTRKQELLQQIRLISPDEQKYQSQLTDKTKLK